MSLLSSLRLVEQQTQRLMTQLLSLQEAEGIHATSTPSPAVASVPITLPNTSREESVRVAQRLQTAIMSSPKTGEQGIH